MFCTNCGKEMKDDSAFCPNCGTKVKMDAVSEGADKAPSVVTAHTEVRKKKRGKGGMIAGIVAAVVVIAAGVGAILYLNSDTYKIGKNVKLASKSYENGDYDEALDYYEKALRLDNSNPDVYEGMVKVNVKLASKSYESGDYDEALDYYEKALRLDKSNPDVYEEMAKVYLQQDECIKAMETVLKGEKATKAESLSEFEEYIRENVVLVKKKYASGGENEYEYDDSGNETKCTFYNSDGTISSWIEYEYDGSGNKTKYTEYNSDGKISRRQEYEYDDSGNETKCTSYKSDGKIDSWNELEYEYDDSGNETKCTWSNSDRTSSWIWWYDIFNNVVNDGSEYTNQYKYIGE